MIILDTNVISEMMRPSPDAVVFQWVSEQDPTDLFTSAVTEAELRFGAEIVPSGSRRRTLVEVIERVILNHFPGRVLPFDRNAVRDYASVAAGRRRIGRPIGYSDCQIAAIAVSTGAAVATRDSGGFQGCGVEVINPWSA